MAREGGIKGGGGGGGEGLLGFWKDRESFGLSFWILLECTSFKSIAVTLIERKTH